MFVIVLINLTNIHSNRRTRMETERQPKLLYRITEAAGLTGYSRSFIYLAINKGELKVVRKGKTVRVLADDLHEWIREQEVEE
ncbi:MAG TPA: DNA-binding protein [Dehalococcoidia bacterium]|nr:DNA-binding protein [Dehalococcoidia bacterium]HIL31244.1 DNA-binding protein [Dehalococcoidia bacterium]